MPGESTTYELYYFPVAGRAELTRRLLEYGGLKYTNRGVKDWKSEKDATPFGQVPVLIFKENGKEIHLAQSAAINRFIAERAGLLPSDPIERAIADSLCEACTEVMDRVIQWKYMTPEPQQAEGKAKLVNETVPTFVKYLTRFLERQGGGGGSDGHFFPAKKLTLAEFHVANVMDNINVFLPGALDEAKAPALAKVAKLVNSQPKIKEYLASDRVLKNPPAH